MKRIVGVSAVVVTYNRKDIVETCLSAARAAEELIVVDKGSTDGTAEIGRRLADKFISVPWSPTVEGTRAHAVAQSTKEWIMLLDDDECLNVEALRFIALAIERQLASVCYIPIRHYILGIHDPRAYYWPEYRPTLFRRGALEFSNAVHGGVRRTTDHVYFVPHDEGPAIEHLSHANVQVYVEKTNRYTSQPVRTGVARAEDVKPARLLELMHQYLAKVPESDDGYLAAVAALRGMYNVVDAIKRWEEARGLDGAQEFRAICTRLMQDYRLALEGEFLP